MPFPLYPSYFLGRFLLFNFIPVSLRTRNIDPRLEKPLAFFISSMLCPLLYIFATNAFRSARLCADGDSTFIRFPALRCDPSSLRMLSISLGSMAMVVRTSDILVSGNNSFPESIRSCIEMSRTPFILQNSRKKVNADIFVTT